MKKRPLNILIAAIVFTLSPSAFAGAPPQPVSESFQRVFPNRELPDFFKVAPDMYQFIVDGRALYLSKDGKLLFTGTLWDVGKKKDLGEAALRRFRREAISVLDEGETVTYAPKKYRYTVNVFTDIDCAYCRKFHRHMPELQKLGIRVNYLLTPLRGKESRTKAVSVWCSADRNRAMDLAKLGKRIPERSCDNPVDEHLRIARLLGLRGTPMLVFENGAAVNGYVPPEELIKELVESAASP